MKKVLIGYEFPLWEGGYGYITNSIGNLGKLEPVYIELFDPSEPFPQPVWFKGIAL